MPTVRTFRFRVVDGNPDSGPFIVEFVSLNTGYQQTFDLAQEFNNRTSFPAMQKAWQAVAPSHRMDPVYWPKVDLTFDESGNIIGVAVRSVSDGD